jgi:predicted ATPase with chaperone activity
MATCKLCGATLPPTEPLAFTDIVGNEHAKRAAEIALAGKHSITFVGGEEAEALAEWCATYGVTAFALKSCPCGNLRHPYKPCECSAAQVIRYRATKRAKRAFAADIVIMTSAPGTDQVMRHQHGQRDVSEERVLERAHHVQETRMAVLDQLEEAGNALLRAFVAQVHPSVRDASSKCARWPSPLPDSP